MGLNSHLHALVAELHYHDGAALQAGADGCCAVGSSCTGNLGATDGVNHHVSALCHTAHAEDTAIALNSWCYTDNNNFRPCEDLVRDLVDIVSKNGCLLLNVGPKPDGTFTEEATAVLRGIGQWLKVNGESIYGTRPWRTYGEGPTQIVEGQFSDRIKKNFTSSDFRFTQGAGYLYATALVRSEDGVYRIRSPGQRDASRIANFSGIIRKVEALGVGEVTWERCEDCLTVNCDAPGSMPLVFRITVD